MRLVSAFAESLSTPTHHTPSLTGPVLSFSKTRPGTLWLRVSSNPQAEGLSLYLSHPVQSNVTNTQRSQCGSTKKGEATGQEEQGLGRSAVSR